MKKNVLKTLLWSAVALLLLYLCFRNVDWKQFGHALGTCRWGWVVLSMLAGLLANWIRGERWRMLLHPIDPSIRWIDTLNAYNISLAANIAVSHVSLLIRCGYVIRHSERDADGRRRLSMDKTLGTVLTDQICDSVGSLLVVAGILLFLRGRFGSFFAGLFSGIDLHAWPFWAVLAGVVLVVGFLLWKLLRSGKRSGWLERVRQFFRGAGQGIATIAHLRRGWLFVLLTVLIWGVFWFQSYAIMLALQDMPEFAGMGPTDALFIMVLGTLSNIIPVPGGFGAYHSIISGAFLAVYGIPFPVGMIFATLAHESWTVAPGVYGLASYLHETYFRKTPSAPAPPALPQY